MIWLSTSAFVLALVAFACAVLVWITSWLQRRELESWKGTLVADLQRRLASATAQHKQISDALRELERQTPVKLAAEVAALTESVQRHADTHRRFAGRVWAAIQHGPPPGSNPNPSVDGVGDDELQAVLALQRATPPKPN